MSIDDEKKKEAGEFNAAQQNAIKKAKDLPKAIYGNRYDGESSESVDGITITKEGPDREYGTPALEELYYGDDDGDVVVNNDVNGERPDREYFPSQLKLEDLVEIIKNNADKMSLMVDRGVDPKITSPEKLKKYLFGDASGAAQRHEGKVMTEEEYVNMLIERYTELWDKREEKKIAASEELKTRVVERAREDEKAAEAVVKKIENITIAKTEENPVTPPEPPAPPKKGFFKRLFGGK